MRPSPRALWLVALGALASVGLAVAIVLLLGSQSPPTTGARTSPPSPLPTPTTRPTASSTPSSSPSPTLSPTPTASVSPILAERFTILVLGTDLNAVRRAAGDSPRTDAIMVVTVDADHEQVDIFSLPRDSVDIPLADGELWTGKVNAIYNARGPDALRDAMATLLGIPIDRYVAVSMDAFERLINVLGTVTVDVSTPLADSRVGFYLQAGPQALDGTTALRFARHRLQGGDYARASRQQQLVVAMAERITEVFAPDSVSGLRTVLRDMDTDVTAGELGDLLELASLTRDARVTTTVFSPPDYAEFEGMAGARGWIMIPDVDAIRARVAEAVSR